MLLFRGTSETILGRFGKLFDHVTGLVTSVAASTVSELITCLSTALETGHKVYTISEPNF